MAFVLLLIDCTAVLLADDTTAATFTSEYKANEGGAGAWISQGYCPRTHLPALNDRQARCMMKTGGREHAQQKLISGVHTTTTTPHVCMMPPTKGGGVYLKVHATSEQELQKYG